ncbi:dienelactone hydrolase family protein [Microbacterium lacus]|uniref:dienelactone hydrolase family protein n=1 Tax=Microbacterium lacus TaxID=415217 RepID=UPI000C2C713B|nr:dienelactone hydrolase family protein [Microbacterium lacus]
MGERIEINGVRVYRAEPAGPPRGAVIVIHEIWGLVDQITRIADRWADEGYLALAPDLLSDIGVTPEVGEELAALNADPDDEKRASLQPRLREALAPIRSPEYAAAAVARLRAVVDHLATLPAVDGRIAVTGFCFGGTYSFALAADDDRVRAAVPFYGTAPEPDAIARISCPVLALYGELDPAIVERLPEVREVMRANDIEFSDHVYPGARHAFFNETNPNTYDPDVAADAWLRATTFVGDQLRGAS